MQAKDLVVTGSASIAGRLGVADNVSFAGGAVYTSGSVLYGVC